MKLSLLSTTGMVLMVLMMSSCAKNAIDLDFQKDDFRNRNLKHGDVDFRHADYVYSECRIRQTVNQRFEYSTLTRHFEYNKDNDPVRVTSDAPGTSQPDLYFKYDKKGNLIEYYGLYSGGPSFEFLHRYGYSDDRIVVDTMYTRGEYPNPTQYYSKRVRYLKYDELNRVVADSEVYVYPAHFINIINYNYDGNGNLIKNGASYDTKVSPQRTNKIWMFVDRNYSLNNVVAASSYTNSGLPLKLSGDPYVSSMTFAYFYYYGSADIIYDCIEQGKKFSGSTPN